MKPASATMSAPWRSMRSASAASNASRARERAVVDDLGGDAALARERQAGGVGAVADDGGDARVPALVGAGADDRLHVGAAAGDEDDDVLHRRAQCIGAAGRETYNRAAFAGPASMSDPSPASSDAARRRRRQREAAGARRRVLSGMRPTGAMHLGHWHGALKNWVRLQDEYECFFFAADWHALTTHYEEREVIESSVYDMVTDWLAAGLDPDKVDALHPEPPARARRAVHAARDGDAARLARAHADLQGPDRAA